MEDQEAMQVMEAEQETAEMEGSSFWVFLTEGTRWVSSLTAALAA
jgi:hypothetical protein